MAGVEKFPDLTPDQKLALQGDVGVPQSEVDTMDAAVTELDDGSVEVAFTDEDFEEEEELLERAILEGDFNANLAELLEEAELEEVGLDLLAKIENDEDARKEWTDILADGIDLLGLTLDDPSEEIFQGAASVKHPLLIESVTKFQSKAFAELFPSKGAVRTQIMGLSSPEKEQQSKRVKEFMNYQLMHQMPEYGPELDRLLFYVALAGSAFKKTYYDPVLNRPVSQFVSAENFIVPYDANDLISCERYTHKMKMSVNEIKRLQLEGFYVDIDLTDPPDIETNAVSDVQDDIEGSRQSSNEAEEYVVYECHVILDLVGFEHVGPDGEPTGLQLPYIVTLTDEGKVLSIRRNWREEDVSYSKRMFFSHYKFVPGLRFYGYGYLHLIGGLAKSSTAILRQLIDAGTFATLPAGFKAHGLRTVGDNSPISPGEFRDVQVPAGELKNAIIPLPFKEPSATLYNLLEFVVRAAEKFADSTEQLVSEAKTYGPVGTVMALLEQGGKLFSAIHKRMHYAQMQDFKMLAEINYEWIPEEGYPYEVVGNSDTVLKEDFDGRVDVIPVSDPNVPTQSHRMAKSQAIMAVAGQIPQEHNMRVVLKNFYDSMQVDDPEKFLKPLPPQAKPADPITENIWAMKGMPLAAAPAQLHIAHIKAHYAFAQLPNMKTNPIAGQSLLSHIQDHIALDYRNRIQIILGMELPPPGSPIPPQLENKIAIAAAEATEQLLQEEIMKEIMQDPSVFVALQGLEVEREKIAQKTKIDLGKLDLSRKEMLLDFESDERDRDNDYAIAALRDYPHKEDD